MAIGVEIGAERRAAAIRISSPTWKLSDRAWCTGNRAGVSARIWRCASTWVVASAGGLLACRRRPKRRPGVHAALGRHGSGTGGAGGEADAHRRRELRDDRVAISKLATRTAGAAWKNAERGVKRRCACARMRTGTPISEGCPTRVNGPLSGLSCAIVLNSGESSALHHVVATRRSAPLCHRRRRLCGRRRLRLFVDPEAHVQLSRPYWRQRVITAGCGTRSKRATLPPVTDAMGLARPARLWLKRALSWLVGGRGARPRLGQLSVCRVRAHLSAPATRLAERAAVVPFSGRRPYGGLCSGADMSTASGWSRFRERNLGFLLLRRHSRGAGAAPALRRGYVRCSTARLAQGAQRGPGCVALRSSPYAVAFMKGRTAGSAGWSFALHASGFPRRWYCGRCLFMHHGEVDSTCRPGLSSAAARRLASDRESQRGGPRGGETSRGQWSDRATAACFSS